MIFFIFDMLLKTSDIQPVHIQLILFYLTESMLLFLLVLNWTEYFGDLSMPVSFDPSRINPHIIKNSLAGRRLVFSGENAEFGYLGDKLAAKGHLKVKSLNWWKKQTWKFMYTIWSISGFYCRGICKVFHSVTYSMPSLYTVGSAQWTNPSY